MRGDDGICGSFFSYIDLDKRIRPDHRLRLIRDIANTALKTLSGEFGKLGGINWSSQHNREECCDGRETAVGSSVTGQVEVARAAGDGAT